MADITKCNGLGCPHKETCYRYTAEAEEYQSYFLSPPLKDNKCDLYWGENSQNMWNQLNQIANNEHTR